MDEYKMGIGVGLLSISVVCLIIGGVFNEPRLSLIAIIPMFLGVGLSAYWIFKPIQSFDNPCVCGHMDYYHDRDITSRKECEQCSCLEFKERVLPELNTNEFMTFREWRESKCDN